MQAITKWVVNITVIIVSLISGFFLTEKIVGGFQQGAGSMGNIAAVIAYIAFGMFLSIRYLMSYFLNEKEVSKSFKVLLFVFLACTAWA
jgi:uncharacterized protein YneF (UPF0154 family)